MWVRRVQRTAVVGCGVHGGGAPAGRRRMPSVAKVRGGGGKYCGQVAEVPKPDMAAVDVMVSKVGDNDDWE